MSYGFAGSYKIYKNGKLVSKGKNFVTDLFLERWMTNTLGGTGKECRFYFGFGSFDTNRANANITGYQHHEDYDTQDSTTSGLVEGSYGLYTQNYSTTFTGANWAGTFNQMGIRFYNSTSGATISSNGTNVDARFQILANNGQQASVQVEVSDTITVDYSISCYVYADYSYANLDVAGTQRKIAFCHVGHQASLVSQATPFEMFFIDSRGKGSASEQNSIFTMWDDPDTNVKTCPPNGINDAELSIAQTSQTSSPWSTNGWSFLGRVNDTLTSATTYIQKTGNYSLGTNGEWWFEVEIRLDLTESEFVTRTASNDIGAFLFYGITTVATQSQNKVWGHLFLDPPITTVETQLWFRMKVHVASRSDVGNNVPLALQVHPSSITETGANGTITTGSARVLPQGGVPPYTYLWSRVSGDTKLGVVGSTNETVEWTYLGTDESANEQWQCEVTDSNGTTATDTIDLSVVYGTGGASLSVTVTDGAINETIQNGTDTETVESQTATATGGIAPYTYSWTRVSGGTALTAIDQTSQTTRWRASGARSEESTSEVWQCEVTDSTPVTPLTATDTCTIDVNWTETIVIWDGDGTLAFRLGTASTSNSFTFESNGDCLFSDNGGTAVTPPSGDWANQAVTGSNYELEVLSIDTTNIGSATHTGDLSTVGVYGLGSVRQSLLSRSAFGQSSVTLSVRIREVGQATWQPAFNLVQQCNSEP